MARNKDEAEQLLHKIRSGYIANNEQEPLSDTEWLKKPCVYSCNGEYGVMAFGEDGEFYEFTSTEDVVDAAYQHDCSQLKW